MDRQAEACGGCDTTLVVDARFCHSCGAGVVDRSVPVGDDADAPDARNDLRFVLWLALAAAAAIKVRRCSAPTSMEIRVRRVSISAT